MEFIYQKHRLGIRSGSGAFHDLQSWLETELSPMYLYDLELLKARVDFFKKSLSFVKPENIHFAVKANHSPEILKLIASQGLGADTVSIGEVKAAITSGFNTKNIIFSGVAKTKSEIREALKLQIKQINIESLAELKRIIDLCKETSSAIELGIRLNPRVAAKTHPSISTGDADHKFGVDLSELPDVKKLLKENSQLVTLRCLSQHIGSNMLGLNEFELSLEKLEVTLKEFTADGFKIDRLDLGGGLGVDYYTYDLKKDEALIGDYANSLKKFHERHPAEQIMLEPGRVLVARAGALVTQVQYIKKNGSSHFAILNSGMNHLLRPALYQAHHQYWPVVQRPVNGEKMHLVGPICESTDVFARNLDLHLQQDDFVVILDCGAYGMSMSSSYNLHDFPAERFFDGSHFRT